ncbi:MAG TPA: hypothetical protein VGF18_09845 [Candidatus Tumulicola sp.]|jgi:hypothetical protein
MIAAIVAIVVAIVAIVIVIGGRRRLVPVPRAPGTAGAHITSAAATANWAGDEYAGLSEAARCDLIFAVQELPGEERTAMLAGALNDPSETVALAAAKALSARGERALVDRYFDAHPGARTDRVRDDLSLLS